MGKRIPEDKRDVARALVKAGKSYREVAEALSIGVGSVHAIMTESVEVLAPLVEEIKKRFAMKHYLLADHILSRIHDTDFYYMSLKDKVITSAILIDKARLMEGSSTDNIAVGVVTPSTGVVTPSTGVITPHADAPAPGPTKMDDMNNLNDMNRPEEAEIEEIKEVSEARPASN